MLNGIHGRPVRHQFSNKHRGGSRGPTSNTLLSAGGRILSRRGGEGLSQMTETDVNGLLRQLEKHAEAVAKITCYSTLPGIYGFFLLKGCLCIGKKTLNGGNGVLLYVGKTESSQQNHCADEHLTSGQTGRSTLRRSLGALLREQLNLRPHPRSDSEKGTKRFTNYKFDAAGEERLTGWMKEHLSLGYCEMRELTIAQLGAREKNLIRSAKPPLNIKDNSESPYRAELKSARSHCVSLARQPSC